MTNGILLNGSADIDFMIHGVFPYQFFGQTVWITTTHICLLIVLLLILAFAIAANRAMKHASEVPGFFQNIVELVVEKLDGMVKMVMGKNAAKFANYIGTIFIFILISNFFTLVVEIVPMLTIGIRIILIIIRHSILPSVCQHSAIFAYIVVIVYPCVGLHISLIIEVEPFTAIFFPLACYHLIIAIIVVPNTSVIFLPTSCERSHGSTHSE